MSKKYHSDSDDETISKTDESVGTEILRTPSQSQTISKVFSFSVLSSKKKLNNELDLKVNELYAMFSNPKFSKNGYDPDSRDIRYVQNILKKLEEHPENRCLVLISLTSKDGKPLANMTIISEMDDRIILPKDMISERTPMNEEFFSKHMKISLCNNNLYKHFQNPFFCLNMDEEDKLCQDIRALFVDEKAGTRSIKSSASLLDKAITSEVSIYDYIIKCLTEENIYIYFDKPQFMICSWTEMDLRPKNLDISLRFKVSQLLTQQSPGFALHWSDKITSQMISNVGVLNENCASEMRKINRFVSVQPFLIQFADKIYNTKNNTYVSDSLGARENLCLPIVDMTHMRATEFEDISPRDNFSFIYKQITKFFNDQNKLGDVIFWRLIYRLLIGNVPDDSFGRGENLLIVSDPKTGKTTIMKLISGFHSSCFLMSQNPGMFSYAGLINKPTIIIFEEFASGHSCSLLKNIWNGEELKVSIKHKSDETIRVDSPCIVLTNNCNGFIDLSSSDFNALLSRVSFYKFESVASSLKGITDTNRLGSVVLLRLALNEMGIKIGSGEKKFNREWFENTEQVNIINNYMIDIEMYKTTTEKISVEKQKRWNRVAIELVRSSVHKLFFHITWYCLSENFESNYDLLNSFLISKLGSQYDTIVTENISKDLEDMRELFSRDTIEKLIKDLRRKQQESRRKVSDLWINGYDKIVSKSTASL